jgi:8-oxo-dGTP pyrophosphatase MutT (NUDIX family)
MAPQHRGGWPDGITSDRARDAAGLLLLFPIDAISHIVLTVRAAGVRHGGQVSLPGGVVEPGESLVDAALRETHEEVAFAADDVRVLGTLTPLDIPVSGFRLHAVVAALDRRPSFRPSDSEVARILEVPVATLLDSATVGWHSMMRGGTELTVPAFVTHGALIWGATAMVLAEFLTLLGWDRQNDNRSCADSARIDHHESHF